MIPPANSPSNYTLYTGIHVEDRTDTSGFPSGAGSLNFAGSDVFQLYDSREAVLGLISGSETLPGSATCSREVSATAFSLWIAANLDDTVAVIESV